MHEIKISFLCNDVRDAPVTMHVSPRDENYDFSAPFAMGRVVPTPDPDDEGFCGHPSESQIRRTYAETRGRSVIILFTTLDLIR